MNREDDTRKIERNAGNTDERQGGTHLLALTGQASYRWDVVSDRLEWSGNFAGLVGFEGKAAISTGRDFEKLIAAEGSQSRFGLVKGTVEQAEPGSAVSYQCVYAVAAKHVRTKEPVWLEDTGVWQADAYGRPVQAEGVVRVISERRQREETLRRKSDFDDLTGLSNRRFLEWKIDETLKVCHENDETSAFLIIGIDRLDLVNDFYGFNVGDEVIRQCGERIAARLRADDLVARFSGAKFGVILRNCSAKEIYVASRRFLDALHSEFIETSAGPVSPNASVGACLLPRHAASVREAVAVASIACKTACRQNGYRIGVYEPNPEMKELRKREAELAQALAGALIGSSKDHAISLAFQPVVETESGGIAFHECLVRMDNAPKGLEMGGKIVSIASRLGFIGALDHRSLELALDQLSRDQKTKLSLNVSNETAEDPLWLSKLANGVNRISGAAERLIIEITESHAAGDLNEAAKFVSSIHGLGCKVAIDDFGAGFTSFTNLKALPVDIIKIDGSFASKLFEDEKDAVFVRSLIEIARAFDAKIVVEWVEDWLTADMLAGWGVDYLQGHLFGEATARPQLAPRAPKPGEGRSLTGMSRRA